ncbi:hypothetical protein T4D_12680 [Trichinella pseudospiralis]|nr:hypothetical protein T4D_12680 [Trichinella pseudospiralis]
MSSGIGATVINRAAHSHAIPIAKVVLVLTLAHGNMSHFQFTDNTDISSQLLTDRRWSDSTS